MDGKVVVLPKIAPVAMVEQLRFEDSIREVTINRTTGTWFACFTVEDGPTVGVDVGVGTMATCSDRTVVDNPKALSSALSQLRRVDKPSPAAGTCTVGTITRTGGSGCTPGFAGSTPGWSMFATTTITRQRRR